MLRPIVCIAVVVLGTATAMVYNYQPVAGGEAPAAAVVAATSDPAAKAADPASITDAGKVATPAPTLTATPPQTAAPVTSGASAPVAAAIDVIVAPVKRVMPKLVVLKPVVLKPVAKPAVKDVKSAPATTKAAAIKSKPKKVTENEKGSKKVSRD